MSLFRELVCIDDGTTDGVLVFVWPRWNEWLVRGVDDNFIDVVIVGIQLELHDGSYEMQQRCQFFAISGACLHWRRFYRLSTCLCLKLKCNKDVYFSLFQELVCIDDGSTDWVLVFVWPRWNEWLVRGVDDSFIDVVIVGIQLELNDGSNEMQQRYEFVFTFNI